MADTRAGPRPDEVAARTFPTSFRGFDPAQVRGYLAEVASALAAAAAREEALRDDLARTRATLANPALDETVLLAALGDEAGRLLAAAKEAASDIRRKADANASIALDQAHTQAERILADAQASAHRVRGDAEGVLAIRTEEAEQAARRVLHAAEGDAALLKEGGLAEARSMVAEARAVRERMLGDLKQRLQRGEATVEVLRVGRERLLEAFGVVKDRLDDASHALATAEARARTEAEDQAQRLGGEAAAVVDRLVLIEPSPAAAEQDAEPDAEKPSAARADRPPAAEVDTGEPSGEVAEVVPIGGTVVVEVEDDEHAPTPVFDSPAAAPTTGEVPAIAATGTDSGGVGHRRRRMLRLADEPAVRAEEQRLTQLRYLHRPRTGGEAEVHLPEDGMVVVEPPSADEGVRLLRNGGARTGLQARGPLPSADREGAASTATAPAARTASTPGPRRSSPAQAPSTRVTPAAPRTTAQPAGTPTRPAPPSSPAPPIPLLTPDPVAAPFAPPPTRSTSPEPGAIPAAATRTGPSRPDATDLFARLRAERGHEPARDAAPTAAGPRTAGEPASDDELALQARDAAVLPVEHLLAKKVKRLLQDHQNGVLDRLRAKRPPGALELLGEVEDLLGPLATVAEPLLGDAAQAGAAAAGAPDAKVPSADLARDIAANVVKDLRPRLEVAYSVVHPERRADRVNVAFREWRGERVGRLVADAAQAAFARGHFVACPRRTPLRWVADDGERPCAECEDNALAGTVSKGTAFPTGHRHPPAHSGCRCLLIAAPGRPAGPTPSTP